MKKQEILKKIEEALTTTLEHNNFELTEKTTAEDVDGWESVTHMMIISELENTLSIKFKLMDLMNMNNVGDLMRIIEKEL